MNVYVNLTYTYMLILLKNVLPQIVSNVSKCYIYYVNFYIIFVLLSNIFILFQINAKI